MVKFIPLVSGVNDDMARVDFLIVMTADSDNFVFSPLSPQILLSCLTKETKNDSSSYKELKEIVRYKDSRELETLIDTMLKEKTTRELKIASAFFMKKDPKYIVLK